MNKFEEFLNSLTDHELAKFIGYRFDEFLEESKRKIILETKNRNLDKSKLVELFNRPFGIVSGKEKCPNCGSLRLFIETDYDVRAKGSYSTVEVALYSKRCQICNYNSLKRKPKNLFDRIKIIWEKKENKRITKWNFWD